MVSGGRREGEQGQGDKFLDSVELLNLDGTWICTMPQMPEARSGHTQSGPVICGGSGSATKKSCITFFSGGKDWVKTHNLTKERQWHSAWASPRGVMLMGGFDHKTTTEILTGDGDTNPGFSLDYRTK